MNDFTERGLCVTWCYAGCVGLQIYLSRLKEIDFCDFRFIFIHTVDDL